MRSFYLATHKEAEARLSRKVPDLSETRHELDVLGTKIIKALAKRKQYPYNPKAKMEFAGIRPEIVELYLPMLKLLCKAGSETSEESARIDLEILALLQKRILKAYDAAAYKKLHKMKISDGAREKLVLENAVNDAKEFGINPEIGRAIMKIIIENTKKLEERIF